ARYSETLPWQTLAGERSITFTDGGRWQTDRLEALLNVFEEVLRHSLIPGVVGMQAVRAQQVVGDAAKRVIQVDERDACALAGNHDTNEVVGWRDVLGRIGPAGARALR